MKTKLLLILSLVVPSLCFGESILVRINFLNDKVTVIWKSNSIPVRTFYFPTGDGKISIRDSKEITAMIVQFALDYEMNLQRSNLLKPDKVDKMITSNDKRLHWTHLLDAFLHTLISHDFMITHVRDEPSTLYNKIEVFAHKQNYKRISSPDIDQSQGSQGTKATSKDK